MSKVNTCVVFFKYKPYSDTDDWVDGVEYGRYGQGRTCETAADVIDQVVRYHRQSSYSYKLINVIMD